MKRRAAMGKKTVIKEDKMNFKGDSILLRSHNSFSYLANDIDIWMVFSRKRCLPKFINLTNKQ